jgi:hypothetical protein
MKTAIAVESQFCVDVFGWAGALEMRFYTDPETHELHVHGHEVSEAEVETVSSRPVEDRRGTGGPRAASGTTREGRYLRVIHVPEPVPAPPTVSFTHWDTICRRGLVPIPRPE